MVKRLYVEKKKGFDSLGESLLLDIRQNLHIENLEKLRIINRYDIDGIDDDTFEEAKYTVFAEPPIDKAFEEELPDMGTANFFAVEFLPGQYDQRADSAAICIKLMNPQAEAAVKYAKIYVLEGDLTQSEIDKIKNYCVNPVDSQLAELSKPDSIEIKTTEPKPVEIIKDFVDFDEDRLMEYRAKMGFAMSDGDIAHIQNYFKNEEKRNPTITELKVIDTYWSDHCRHTTFHTTLTDIYFDETEYGKLVQEVFSEYMDMREEVYGDENRDICLMDMALIGTKYLKQKGLAKNLDESEEINACSIKVKAEIDGKEEDWLVMFKNETHNHPTEIEPFGGAATCLGGAIRDPLSGRVYVYQAMRVTGAADPNVAIEDTLEGKLPQRKITRDAAAGYSSYGNQIGLATGLVDEVYDSSYVAKRMEVGAVIGAAPAKNVRREVPTAGDVIILVGGKTGRDGLGGATGSSKKHDITSIETCGAEVQKGNPPVERNIQRLFRRYEAAALIKRCNDFGAGGVSVAIGELADGIEIDLNKVPKKYEGLDGTELAISESQERMAVVVAKEDEEKFKALAFDENLEATTVAKVTDKNRVTMEFKGQKVLDLSRDFLETNGAQQKTTVLVKRQKNEKLVDMLNVAMRPSDDYNYYLKDLNCSSKKGLIERFDSTIGAGTVLLPLGGKYQLSPQAGMAAKLPVREGNTSTATLMAYGYDPKIAKASPYHGAIYAIIDSVTKIVAMGGNIEDIKLTFQEYFEKLAGDENWGKPVAAVLGALKVQKELGIPAIGGKDSMSGTFLDINVPPALISFAVNTINANKIISSELKGIGNQLILIKPEYNNKNIDFDSYKEKMAVAMELIEKGLCISALPVGRGGALITLGKMAVGNKIGFDVKMDKANFLDANYGSIILECKPSKKLEKILEASDVINLGKTAKNETMIFNVDKEKIEINIDDYINEWTKPLESVFPTYCNQDGKVENIKYTDRNTNKPEKKVEKPLVIIPTFPGTNCEVDSARAFEKAGAKTIIHKINNLSKESLTKSISELAQLISKAQIVMIPGGFSGGDEPDGSAKFITAVFRNPEVKEAVEDLLENRDGLMLGICNGFQALIKLGLVPYGKIVDMDDNSPTLSYNKIGRHVSCIVDTKISSVKSPWFANVNVDEVYKIPVSHGEGNFICSEEILKELVENGQVATQYVDFDGNPTMDIKYNPNNSVMAIEAITSKDGRILGKMGHSERIGENVYKNVIGEKDMKIFEAGVKYFQK